MERFSWWRMEQVQHSLSRALCGAFCSILHHVKRSLSHSPLTRYVYYKHHNWVQIKKVLPVLPHRFCQDRQILPRNIMPRFTTFTKHQPLSPPPLASLALQALLASSTACAARPPSISPISPNRTGYSHPADLRTGSDRHLQGGLSVNHALTNVPGTACLSDTVTFFIVTNLTRPIY